AAAMAALLTIAGCASDSQSRVGNAAAAPLTDLNVVRTDVPPVLEEALKQPYLVPAEQSCEALVKQVSELDAVLGADFDAPSADSKRDVAGDAAIGALQRTAEGFIPFHGLVRQLSGAERHARHAAAAIAAGTARRAFLKGFGASRGCSWNKP